MYTKENGKLKKTTEVHFFSKKKKDQSRLEEKINCISFNLVVDRLAHEYTKLKC